VALFVFLVLDVIIRYSQHLREVDSPWGFLEWLTCLVRRKKVTALPAEAAVPSVAVPTKTSSGEEPNPQREAA
jgi:hypothetical protein